MNDNSTPPQAPGSFPATRWNLVREPAVRIAAFKLRNRYRDLLKKNISQTVSNEAEVQEELAHLRAAFVD